MSTEKIHFKIALSGTYWDKKPHFTISVNDTEYVNDFISKDPEEEQFIEFDCEVEEEKSHVLKIRLDNKEVTDTVTDGGDPEKCEIVQDMLLNLISIEVDDIELGNITQMCGVFKYDEPQHFPAPNTTELPKCVNFGFNGTYELEFTSPFYLWLLEKI